jgi:hypothetical protein
VRKLPPAQFWQKHADELGGLRALSDLAASSERGRLDGRVRGLAVALSGLSGAYPDVYESRFKPDAVAAIEERDMPRLARVLLSFMEFVMLGGATRERKGAHARHADGATLTNKGKRRRPSPAEVRLEIHERRYGPLKPRSQNLAEVARRLSMSAGHLRRLLRKRRAARTTR